MFFLFFSGHKSEIYTGKFHPSGNWLASAGMERLVYLWSVYGECENVSIMSGHSGPIIQLCFSDVSLILFACVNLVGIQMFNIFDLMEMGMETS